MLPFLYSEVSEKAYASSRYHLFSHCIKVLLFCLHLYGKTRFYHTPKTSLYTQLQVVNTHIPIFCVNQCFCNFFIVMALLHLLLQSCPTNILCSQYECDLLFGLLPSTKQLFTPELFYCFIENHTSFYCKTLVKSFTFLILYQG